MQYQIRLGGDQGNRLVGRDVGDMLEALDTGAKKALRLSVEGRSEISGAYPRSLAPGARFTLEEVHPSRALLVLESPLLSDVLVDPRIRADVPAGTSAIGLFADGMRDAIAGREASDLVDESLVTTYEEIGKIVDRVGPVSMVNGKVDAEPVVLSPSSLAKIREYNFEKPRPRTMRVSGVINTIRKSDKAFTLVLMSGLSLRGVYAADTGVELRKFYGKRVVASGVVEFRNSGRPLLLMANHLDIPSAEEYELWSKDPRPLEGTGSNPFKQKIQGPRSGMNAFFGKWPLEMSDEDFLRLTEND